jgi:segregation and condensation protein B
VIKTLEERGWVETIGHREAPGRPGLLATTRAFLDDFGLRSLQELPPIGADEHSLNARIELPFPDSAPSPLPVSVPLAQEPIHHPPDSGNPPSAMNEMSNANT